MNISLQWGLCPQTPGILRFRARILGRESEIRARPRGIPATESALGFHPWRALSSVQLVPDYQDYSVLKWTRLKLRADVTSVSDVAGLKCQRCSRPDTGDPPGGKRSRRSRPKRHGWRTNALRRGGAAGKGTVTARRPCLGGASQGTRFPRGFWTERWRGFQRRDIEKTRIKC
jgi:hypothetical protein